MKKTFGIILFNLLIIIVILLFVDYIQMYLFFNKPEPYPYIELSDRYEATDLPYLKNKKPIVLIGCSYTYGYNIDKKETFSHKLQEKTKRKVFNTGKNGEAMAYFIYKAQTSDLLKKDSLKDLQPPEYIIYTFIPDHIRRLYVNFFNENVRDKNLKYSLKKVNGEKKLVLDDVFNVHFVDYIKKFITYERISNFIIKQKSDDEKFDFFKLHLLEFKKSLGPEFKDTKIVILLYPPNYKDSSHFPKFTTDRWSELEDEGFIIIDLYNDKFSHFVKDEYRTVDEVHPSGKAWDEIIPVIIDKLKL